MSDLVIDAVRKRLGANQILKGVSLTVPSGEIVALLGQSGSGKTTLLRCVAGLEVPEEGRITLGGRVLLDAGTHVALAPEKRGLALVFQSYALWPHRTIFDNVAYGLKLRRLGAAAIDKRATEIMTRLGLAELRDRFPHQLSGGQQQRVALARALVYEPPVLLLDEPLSNLDAKLREDARAWLRQIIKQAGMSALYVTHDQAEAMAVCDRIMLLHQGEAAQTGTPETLYNRPASAFVADFMGSNNALKGRVVSAGGGRAEIAGKNWRLEGSAMNASPKGEAMIRVERTRIATAARENAIEMTLDSALYLGERWELRFARDGVEVRVWSTTRLDPGKYWVEFPPADLWVF
jgi:iron(III) transport system ATP-binding protein